MEKQESNSNHFVLKGLTSILIGGYIFIGAYILETIIKNYTSNNYNRILFFLIPIFTFLLATFTIYVRAKKSAEKTDQKLWNIQSNINFRKYSIGFCFIFLVLSFLYFTELTGYLAPVFLISYGILLFILKNPRRKDFLILSALSVILGILCFLIPSYWNASLTILGIAHITYGVVVKK